MILLLLALGALAVGPVAYRSLSGRPHALALLDGLVYVAVPGLVLLHLAPEVLGERHLLPLVAMALGVFAPLWLEHQTHRVGERADHAALVLGISGLALHALLEGAALQGIALDGDLALGGAVLLHRVPVGLAVWWLLRPRVGVGLSGVAIGGLMAATLVGWGAGGSLVAMLEGEIVHLYEAFVGGTLVHVIFHGRPAGAKLADDRLAPSFEGVGGALGLILIAVLAAGAGAPEAHLHEGDHAVLEFGSRLLGLTLESAPALVLAYVAAGLLSAFMPTGSIRWMARGGHLSSAARGMAVGLPVPVCSCGVVPVYEALVRRGAPPAAALAFLIATPELGLDAIFLSIPLLGGPMTLLRVAVAAAAALLVGWWVGRLLDPREATPEDAVTPVASGAFAERFAAGMRTGLRDVVDHTAPWIVLGLLVAAAATPFLEGGWLSELASPIDVLVFTLLGLPMYVCASSATPLVAALMAGGLSPGAAIAFLITGPATNVTTFGVVSGLHGRRGALLFAGTLIGFTVLTGATVNAVVADLPLPAYEEIISDEGSGIQRISLVLLTLLFGASLLRRGVRASIGELRSGLGTGSHSHDAHDHGEHGHDCGPGDGPHAGDGCSSGRCSVPAASHLMGDEVGARGGRGGAGEA